MAVNPKYVPFFIFVAFFATILSMVLLCERMYRTIFLPVGALGDGIRQHGGGAQGGGIDLGIPVGVPTGVMVQWYHATWRRCTRWWHNSRNTSRSACKCVA
jgi:hypothetical protein